MKAKTNIKICFSTRVKHDDFMEWESFWEATNEDSFGRNSASYKVAIRYPMAIDEFERIAEEIKKVIAHHNNCIVNQSCDRVTQNQNGMISDITYYFVGI